MLSEYSEFTGLSIDEINENISNFKKLLSDDVSKYGHIPTIINSKNLIFETLSYPFESSDTALIGKYQLFSPQLLPLALNSGYRTLLEFMGGLGLLSEISKKYSPNMEVDFCSMNNHITDFASWRFSKRDVKVNVSNDISRTYDVIISDGLLHYLNSSEQEILLRNMISRVNKNGLLAILVDLSGKDESNLLKQEVDIIKLHNILEQSDMLCIYGKNTFSSLWKKMI
jgi:hypothetical protein